MVPCGQIFLDSAEFPRREAAVIPMPEQLEELARLEEGTFPQVTFPALLFSFAVQKRTVVLEIRRHQLWKKIVLENGVPVDCRSNLAHETLGRYMVTESKLSEEDFNTCLSRSAARGVPLGEVLLEQGLISAVELFKILQANLAQKLLDIFTWRDGEFRTLTDVPQPDSSLKVKVPQLILTGVTKCSPQEEVDMAVGPLVGKKLALNPMPPFALEDIRLSPRQGQLTDALRAGRRLGELAEATGQPFDEITRLVYALSVIGVVTPADSLPKTADGLPATVTGSLAIPVIAPKPAPPAAITSETAVTVPFPFSPADAERRRNEIMQAYLSYRRQDSFDLLGVPEAAPISVIEQKYLEFAQRVSPWSSGPELAGMEEKLYDLFLAGARAFAELADTEQRNTLIFRRKTLRDEREKKPATFAIKTDLLDSEAQFKKGKALLDAGKYREAAQLLAFASDCDPQNSLYSAELGWCRYLQAPNLPDQPLKELEETARRDPRCGIAFYYLGEIHRQLGNYFEAEDHLQKAIKLMSPDRRPIEALKALSAEKKR